jgi:polyisoprenoid-binding protein YceI
VASFLLGNLTLVTWNIPANADDAVKPKAPAGVYALDPHHASLQWSLPHNGISHYSARFDRLEAEITFDPVNLANCSVRATIDPTSVSAAFPVDFYKASFPKSGYASWSEDIAKNPVYLNANAFPTITFKSRSVALTGPRSADVKGDLTFLGLTKPVTLAAAATARRHEALGGVRGAGDPCDLLCPASGAAAVGLDVRVGRLGCGGGSGAGGGDELVRSVSYPAYRTGGSGGRGAPHRRLPGKRRP